MQYLGLTKMKRRKSENDILADVDLHMKSAFLFKTSHMYWARHFHS